MCTELDHHEVLVARDQGQGKEATCLNVFTAITEFTKGATKSTTAVRSIKMNVLSGTQPLLRVRQAAEFPGAAATFASGGHLLRIPS